MDKGTPHLSVASDAASQLLKATEVIANGLDDLVQQGKEDELRAVREKMLIADDLLAAVAEQTLEARDTHVAKHIDLMEGVSEVRATVDLLVAEKRSNANEIIRLLNEEDRLEREPMLEHVRLATSTCITDHMMRQQNLQAQSSATDAHLVKTIDGLVEWLEEMKAMEKVLQEIGAAELAMADALQKLETAEAEVVARRLPASGTQMSDSA